MVVTTSGPDVRTSIRRLALSVSAVVLTASWAPDKAVGMQAGPGTWTARPASVLEVPGGVNTGAGSSARLRVGAAGTRIVIVTGDLLRRLDWRLPIWTPDGALLLATESAEVAEGLTLPSGLRAGVDGFRLRHSDRYVWYAYEDARTLQSVFPPSGFGRFIPLADGGLLGLGRIPGWFDGGGVKPEAQAIIHVRRVGETWKPDTIGVRDIRHDGWYVQLPPDPSQPPFRHRPQPESRVVATYADSAVVFYREVVPTERGVRIGAHAGRVTLNPLRRVSGEPCADMVPSVTGRG